MNKIITIIVVLIIAIGIGVLAYLFSPDETSREREKTVEVFFTNVEETPEMLDCSKVFPVERVISLEEEDVLAALTIEKLLEGPTEEEAMQGYITNINPGTELIDFNIEEGTATADFNKVIEEEVGGSCWVIAIRAQITETLMQFPDIEEVIISIEGQTEDILQP